MWKSCRLRSSVSACRGGHRWNDRHTYGTSATSARDVAGARPRGVALRDVDDDALHGVVVVAADVPLAEERLLVPGGVARAEPELVAAERRVPLVRPRRPCPRRIDVVLDARRVP